MAWALVQTAKGNGGGYSNTNVRAFGSNNAAGNLILLAITAGDADTIGSIADTRGNTYTLIGSVGSGTGERKTWLYYAKNIGSGANTITVTFGSGQFPDSVVIAREYSGLDTASPLRGWAGAAAGNWVQSHSSGATTESALANELVVGVIGTSGSSDPTFAAGTGYGNLATQNGFDLYTYGAAEDKNASAGTQTAAFTTTGFVKSQTIVAILKLAASTTQVSVTKQLKYTVKRAATAVTKQLKYTVKRTPTGITKQLKYNVKRAAAAVTKQLKYTVKRAATAVTKQLKYTVKIAPAAITKQAKYVVKATAPAITKQLRYRVRTVAAGITKQLKYRILYVTQGSIAKQLKYSIGVAGTKITKQLKYQVRKPGAVTKPLRYAIDLPAVTIAKQLWYTVEKQATIAKPLSYSIFGPSVLIQKQLKYNIRHTPVAITKQLKYQVYPGIPHVITKQMRYVVKTYPYKKKNIKPYIRQTIKPFVKKASPYVSIPKY